MTNSCVRVRSKFLACEKCLPQCTQKHARTPLAPLDWDDGKISGLCGGTGCGDVGFEVGLRVEVGENL